VSDSPESRSTNEERYIDPQGRSWSAKYSRWVDADDLALIERLTAEVAELRRDNANLRTTMVAAAEEISEHWQAHCDAGGYGPSNLMHRLEAGIPAEYGYTAGAFARLAAQVKELEQAAAANLYAAQKQMLANAVLLEARTPPEAAGTRWELTDEKINSLQVESVDRIIKRCKAAHFTNVRIRINGEWEEHEADWIKHLVRRPPEPGECDYDHEAALEVHRKFCAWCGIRLTKGE